jgi:bacterioferritin (cytochrome b1)
VDKISQVTNPDEARHLLEVALRHEWAVSFEYVIHAYSMPRGKFCYEDPVMRTRTDARSQSIQIGIDEMYHAYQLGLIITKMGGRPSFTTDEVVRHPRIIDNLRRDKKTEEEVTDLYLSVDWEAGRHPELQNMVLNIAADEQRHIRQFAAAIEALEREGATEALCFREGTESACREDVQRLHGITRLENELMHRYLGCAMLFSDHQDLTFRLFKNSLNHMRHWDKNAGLLVELGSVIKIENASTDETGREASVHPMPVLYPCQTRLEALEALVPEEEKLIAAYEALIARLPDGGPKDRLAAQLAVKREHLYTQGALLANARRVQDLR